MKLSKQLTTVTPFSKLLAMVLVILLPIFAFILGTMYQSIVSNINTNTSINPNGALPTPEIIPSSTVISPFPQSNCTKDTDCPTEYGCEALQGQGIAQPVVQQTVTANGVTVIPLPQNNNQSGFTITKGICKLKQGGNCQQDNDCLSGLICHDISPQTSGIQIKKCATATLGSCSGPSDKSCGFGYTCVEGCGPPLERIGDTTPKPFYCEANELVGRPRSCPICLASSTSIATPHGNVNVKNIHVGDVVWTVNKLGNKVAAPVIKIGNTIVPKTHQMIHLVLYDGRNLFVSPGHPTITGITISELNVGETYDNSVIASMQYVPYTDTKTYDILPAGETGAYFANDILVGSTLH